MPRGRQKFPTDAPKQPVRPRGAGVALFALALLFFCMSLGSARVAAQNTSETPGEEIVANLASGRVILLVTKDAILIATVENPIEPETHVPAPVQMGILRAGILLGAEDWFSPSSHRQIARLDRELPHLRVTAQTADPHLGGQVVEQKDAVDLEMIGQGVRRRSTEIVQDLHGKIDLPSEEPFLEVVLVDYIADYGPEIWRISYSLEQQEQNNDYWTTTVTYPLYLQFYPPEKGQPHTLVEFDYPPAKSPTLLDLLRQNDPRLASLSHSDEKMAEVASAILEGRAQKLAAADATPFLRAALELLAPPNVRVTFSQITQQDGFSWILPPPPEPKSPLQQPEREPGAPSLRPSGQ